MTSRNPMAASPTGAGRSDDWRRVDATARGSANLLVHVGYAAARAGVPAATSFRTWVAAALQGTGHRRAAELAIRIVDGEEARSFNRDFRGKDYATNVLSFPAELPPGLRLPLLGDLLLCAPVIVTEAHQQGKRCRDHYAHLTVHGVLHLLGHDHQTRADAQRMEGLESRILTGLGLPDPWQLDE